MYFLGHSLRLCVELIFQMSDLGLQDGDGGFILGLDGSLKLLQLQLQLLILAVQLGASPLQPLRAAALPSQFCGQLLSLIPQTHRTEVLFKCQLK